MTNSARKEIDKLLREKEYDNLCTFLNEYKNDSLVSHDSSLFILVNMGFIYSEERSKNIINHIFYNRSLSDLFSLYSKVSFCLRRIEFDLEEELVLDAINYLIKEKISLICAIGIINFNNNFYTKSDLLKKVIEIYNLIYSPKER